MVVGLHNCTVNPPEDLKAARRALDGIKEFQLLEDWESRPELESWVLNCRITLDIDSSEFVPKSTDWYLIVSMDYPWGEVIFYPSSFGGLEHTFPHQTFNGNNVGELPFRQGRLCIDSSLHSLGRHGGDVEPFGIHDRLVWQVGRAIEWLKDAAADRLAKPGDSFELPDFRQSGQATLAFNENKDSLTTWEKTPNCVGIVDIAVVPQASKTAYVKVFRALNEEAILNVEWGTFLETWGELEPTGIWIRTPSTPVLEPWQAPMTWGELRKALNLQDVDLDQVLSKAVVKIRDGKDHILLLGFPVPDLIGGPSQRMHWLATSLPALTTQHQRGFRTTNDKGRWYKDRKSILKDAVPLKWHNTEDWNIEEFNARGKLSDTLTTKGVAVIGVGALGSAIAEMLVKAGVHDVRICDGENLKAGNLVRHTLSLQSVGVNKAEAVASKLNASSPSGSIAAFGKNISSGTKDKIPWLASADLVIECTGSDKTLSALARLDLPVHTKFVSVSLGMFARRVFVFHAIGTRFPHDQYIAAIDPWLRREMKEHSEVDLPREGIGCWHNLFPARIDDVWMMASVTVKEIEAMMATALEAPILSVKEQIFEDGQFIGLRTGSLV